MTESDQRLELAIEGMTCGHCAEAVRRALVACHNVVSARVELAAGRAIVTGAGLDRQRLADGVRGLGYEPKLP